ncbi:MAG: type IX secretion system membrane protein PorP/SprF [Salibacteraceae bacterium]
MTKKLPLYLLLLLSLTGWAQQDPQFSFNRDNRLFPNPAYAGNGEAICGQVLLRNQWTGFEGNPQTGLVSLHAPIRELHGGLGLSIAADRLGQERTLFAKGAYAYRANLGDGMLSIGLGVGIINKSIGADHRTIGPNGIGDGSEDPRLNQNTVTATKVDFDFGVYYQTNRLYFGLSTTHLNRARVSDVQDFPNIPYELNYRVSRHYYLMSGYRFDFDGTPYALLPSIFVKSDAVSAQVSLDVRGLYRDRVWGGVGYRFQDALIASVGFQESLGDITLRAGYAYDFTTSRLRSFSSGSHELQLGFCMPIPEKITSHKTTRLL